MKYKEVKYKVRIKTSKNSIVQNNENHSQWLPKQWDIFSSTEMFINWNLKVIKNMRLLYHSPLGYLLFWRSRFTSISQNFVQISNSFFFALTKWYYTSGHEKIWFFNCHIPRTTSKLLKISEIKSDIIVFFPRHLIMVGCLMAPWRWKNNAFYCFLAGLLYFLQVSGEVIMFALQKGLKMWWWHYQFGLVTRFKILIVSF